MFVNVYSPTKTLAIKALRIDPRLISTVGHSMGRHMAIEGILDDPSVTCEVAWESENICAQGVGLVNDPNTTIPWSENRL